MRLRGDFIVESHASFAMQMSRSRPGRLVEFFRSGVVIASKASP